MIVPGFNTHLIGQSSFFAGAQNLMSVTVKSNVDLTNTNGELISLCCFENAESSNIVQLDVSAADAGATVIPDLCSDVRAEGGRGTGFWNPATTEVTLYLCPTTSVENKLTAGLQLVVRFNVTNPAVSQPPSVVMIQADDSTTLVSSTTFVLPSVELTPSLATILGVKNATAPMRVVRPELTQRGIGQQSLLAARPNTITVTLQALHPIPKP